MHEEGAEIDGIDIVGVVKNGVVDVLVNRHCELVKCDGEDHLVGVPCLSCGGVGGTQFLVFG